MTAGTPAGAATRLPVGEGGNPPGGGGGANPPGGGQPAVKILGRGKARKADADRRRRAARIRVRCSPGANACAGTVRLRAGGRTIGKGRFTVAAGANGSIRIELNRKARKLLAQRKRVTATLAIAYRDGRARADPAAPDALARTDEPRRAQSATRE